MHWICYHFGLAGLLCTGLLIPPGYLVYSYKQHQRSSFFPVQIHILSHLLIRHVYVFVYRHLKVNIQARTNKLPLRQICSFLESMAPPQPSTLNRQLEITIISLIFTSYKPFSKLTSLLSILKLDSHSLQNL